MPRFDARRLVDLGAFFLSIAVLCACLTYAYLDLSLPQLGFRLSPANWTVLEVQSPCSEDPDCPRVGDRVERVGTLGHDEYLSDRGVYLFRDWPGNSAPLQVTVTRPGIGSKVLRVTPAENIPSLGWLLRWLFPVVLWAIGTVVVVFLRPRGEGFWVLTGLLFSSATWGAAGMVSYSRIGGSAHVFAVLVAFFPTSLIHCHLAVPYRAYARWHRVLLYAAYAASALVAYLAARGQLALEHVFLWVLLGLGISSVLLLVRLFRRSTPERRVVDRLMAVGVCAGLLPFCFLMAIALMNEPRNGQGVNDLIAILLFTLILPIWPLTYLYTLHKFSKSAGEFRANRLFGIYCFFAVYVTLFVTGFVVVTSWLGGREMAVGLGLSLSFAVAAVPLRRGFQQLVDRWVYGIRYQPDEIIGVFAARIPTALDRDNLRRILVDEVLPTLMIRQSCLYVWGEGDEPVEPVYRRGLGDLETVRAFDRARWIRWLENWNPSSSASLRAETEELGLGWVRLALPLMGRDRSIGVWLLGRRDPDDHYPRSDVELLRNIANQIAPVLENMRLVEQARQEVAENRRLHEQLLQSQKMEAIGRLSAGVAHDFNNLLSVILGYSSLLAAKYRGDETLSKYLTDIRDAGDRAASLTRQLLAFSRQQVMEPRVVDLDDVVADVEKMLRRLTGEDIEVVTRFGGDLPQVRIDPGQLGQVIMNLVVNARDAMPDGGRLEIRTCRRRIRSALEDPSQGRIEPGLYSCLEVADDGVGVPREMQAKIFEPYFTTKELGKGTGLGLSMVYGIVNQSKGHIRVESDLGAGTSFVIYLPAVEEAVDEAAVTDRGRRWSEEGHERILLVEDDDSVRHVAGEILQAKGYTIVEAADAGTALEIVAQAEVPFHMLLTDVVMPHMKGTELAARLLDQQPSLRILYMSGYNEESIFGGGEGPRPPLIQKPFSPLSLAQWVRKVLDDDPARPASPREVTAAVSGRGD